MQDIRVLRGWQIQKLQQGLSSIQSIVETTAPDDATTYRDGGQGWTVLEVMCHLRDFEGLFMERATLTVQQDNPELPFPDPDLLAQMHTYNKQQLTEVYTAWRGRRQELIAFFQARDEADWERPAQHPKRGPFTLTDQLFLCALHDSIHIEQMLRILREQRTK